MSRSRRFTFSAGDRGRRVVVYERDPGGPLYARAWDRSLSEGRGGWRRASLGHRDREAAKRYALEQAAKLRDGSAEITAGRVTLGRVLALYLLHRTPRKGASEQQGDRRRAKLWTRVLGGD